MLSWPQPAFDAVASLVNQRAGLSFANRQESAELGMRRAMARARIRDPLQYAERIAADDGALDDLLNELTVGETYFFREPAHFQFIQQRIIPEILEQRGREHRLRAWSAACATGEEAYSLAILFDKLGLADQTHLSATDISRVALAKARQALYSDWSLRGDGASAARPFLTRTGEKHQLVERICQRVTFSPLNLALDVYPSFAAGIWGMDLILCRNVLIYFDKDTVRQTAQRLYQTLADGGWLITASSDPPLWDHVPFEVVAGADGLFYHKPGIEAETGGQGDKVTGRQGEEQSWASASVSVCLPVSESPCPEASPEEDRVDEARQALTRGDYARVICLTADAPEDANSTILHVRALANLDSASAAETCGQAAGRHPLSPELHYLHAVLLLDRDRTEEAARALRRVVYLDRTLAIAHFTLGAILRRRGDVAGACRAYRNARDLCTARPADEAVPMADGEPAGRLAEIAAAELAILDWKE